MKKIALITILAFLFALLGVNVVFAGINGLDVIPNRIPENGVVEIRFENVNSVPLTVEKIVVTYEDSTDYEKSIGVVLDPGDSITEYFGSGISGWTPAADTSNEGKYLVQIKGPMVVGMYFDVSGLFSVPEISFPIALTVAISFALILTISYKRKSK